MFLVANPAPVLCDENDKQGELHINFLAFSDGYVLNRCIAQDCSRSLMALQGVMYQCVWNKIE